MKRVWALLLALALCLGLSAQALAAEPPAEFSDVPATYIFRQAILDCVERGILSGYDDGTFRPGNSVTRAQFCVMLARAFYPGEAGAYDRWSSAGWFGPSAALLRDKGVMVYGDRYWQDPQVMKKNITRRDMSCFLAAVLKEKGYSVSQADKDAARARITDFSAVEEFYEDAVQTVFALGILTGRTDGSFDGSGVTTWGQSATVICRTARCMAAAPGVITAPREPEAVPPATLSNGGQPTEENVPEIMEELRAQYPEGADFSAAYPIGSSSPVRSATHPYPRAADPDTHTSSTLGCGGWSTLVSDAVFGQAGFPVRKVPLMEARPGDVGIMLDEDERLVHVFTILRSPREEPNGKVSFTVTQASTRGGSVYRIHWDDEYTWQAGGAYHYDIWTRYPE